jgi:hypothetical protein
MQCKSAHLQVGVMEGVEEFAALARQYIPQRGALSSTEGFPYPQNLLCPLQNLQANRAPSMIQISGSIKLTLF